MATRGSCVRALGLAVAAAVGVACGDVDTKSNCVVNSNNDAQSSDFNIIHERPSVCPLNFTESEISGGGMWVTFEAVVTVPKNVINDILRLDFFNRNGGHVHPFYDFLWKQDPNDANRLRADPLLATTKRARLGFRLLPESRAIRAY